MGENNYPGMENPDADYANALSDAKGAIENNANHYLLIYWLLFIYLSLQSLDECIELFSVLM